MDYTLEEKHLREIIISAVEIGIMKGTMLKESVKPFVSQREAFRLYGKRAVQRWIKEGLIAEIKDGEDNSKIRIERLQLAKIACACNRDNYKESRKQKQKA